MTTAAERKHKAKLAQKGCALCFVIHGPHEPGFAKYITPCNIMM